PHHRIGGYRRHGLWTTHRSLRPRPSGGVLCTGRTHHLWITLRTPPHTHPELRKRSSLPQHTECRTEVFPQVIHRLARPCGQLHPPARTPVRYCRLAMPRLLSAAPFRHRPDREIFTLANPTFFALVSEPLFLLTDSAIV